MLAGAVVREGDVRAEVDELLDREAVNVRLVHVRRLRVVAAVQLQIGQVQPHVRVVGDRLAHVHEHVQCTRVLRFVRENAACNEERR